MKKILILGASSYNRKLFDQLSDYGFSVIVVDKNPRAGNYVRSHSFSAIDIVQQEDVLRYARKCMVDGVMAVNDFGTRTAAYVANKMGLVGITECAAEAATDKGVMRDVWKAARLPIPAYMIVSSLSALRVAAESIGYPCVLKPTDSGGGGRGVSVVRNPQELEWSYDFAAPYAKNSMLILEEYIEGIELTVESMSVEGKVHILAMSDKVKPDHRTCVATSLNYPANIDDARRREVENIVTQAISVIGITHGMAHTEVMLTKDGVKLLEVGARGGGGHIFHTCIEATTGICAPVECARLLTGMRVVIPDAERKGVVYRFFNPPYGILERVDGIEKARAARGVIDIGIVKQPGDIVGDLHSSLERVGFVVTNGNTRDEAVESADRVESMVKFTIRPLESMAGGAISTDV